MTNSRDVKMTEWMMLERDDGSTMPVRVDRSVYKTLVIDSPEQRVRFKFDGSPESSDTGRCGTLRRMTSDEYDELIGTILLCR